MPYTIHYNREAHIIEVKVKGDVNRDTLDLYSLPNIISDISTPLGINADRLRRALVIAPTYTRDAIFAEDVTVNRGQQAKFFHDIDEARKWLLGK